MSHLNKELKKQNQNGMSKRILVNGAGGFIGSHIVKKLVSQGHFVVGVDRKYPEFSKSAAHEFYIGDLRNIKVYRNIVIGNHIETIYQFAAEMGGAEYTFTGENDLDIVINSMQINLNTVRIAEEASCVKEIFFSSSACCYPQENQMNPDAPECREDTVYPANPDSEYGWEKLMAERLYQSLGRSYPDKRIRIARFHNIYGPEGVFRGNRAKAPAAICRKVAEALINKETHIDIIGDGKQTRSFLEITELLEGVQRLMESDCNKVLNIGSNEMITIQQLTEWVIEIAGAKGKLKIRNIDGPQGVRGRNSDNELIKKELGWAPSKGFRSGLETLYKWVSEEINKESVSGKHVGKVQN